MHGLGLPTFKQSAVRNCDVIATWHYLFLELAISVACPRSREAKEHTRS